MIRVLLFIFIVGQAVNAQLSLRYIDAAGFGFNDTTAVEPVGGNSGETLGRQRQIVLERAAEIWSNFLVVDGPVEVRAQFENIPCQGGAATLASAGALGSLRNFAEAPLRNVQYPAALVNHLSKRDRFPGRSEIQVRVNEEVDRDPMCLGGSGFYYGLDGNSGNQVDLLATLVHELGHGLGFASFVDLTSGRFPSGVVDIYSRHLRDVSVGLDWSEMTDSQRAASAVNQPFVVWTGEGTSLAAQELLTRGTEVKVSFQLNGQMVTTAGLSSIFGPAFEDGDITGEVVLVNDGVEPLADACEDIPPENRAALAGKIALVDRRECPFIDKVSRAEAAGAIAVIIANNDPLPVRPGAAQGAPQPQIPSLMVSEEIGQQLRSEEGIIVTLSLGGGDGTSEGFLKIFAPDPVDFGSSVSHWTTTAQPDLLMEPFLGNLPRQDPDLTLTAMREMGWTVRDIPFPNMNYAIWSELMLSAVAAELRGLTSDPDGDGFDNLEEYVFGSDPDARDSLPDSALQIDGAETELGFQRSNQPTDVRVDIYTSDTLTPASFLPADDLQEVRREVNGEDLRLGFEFTADQAHRFFRLEWSIE